MMSRISWGRLFVLLGLWILGGNPLQAAVFPLPADPNDSVVGEISATVASNDDTLLDIGRRYDLGYEEIIKANPGVNRWVPGAGTKVVLPSRYILPNTAHEGIVLNLPELRLYYYPPAKKGIARVVETFPVSIGRMDWRTPLGKTKVTGKEKDPAWRPTKSVRAEHAQDGDILPDFIKGGDPENPLGHYALRLGLPSYLIHGVDERKSFGIGMRVTHGCVRMYPEDIQRLFEMVAVGTAVQIINQPIKSGWLGPDLYLEANLPFEEEDSSQTDITPERAIDILADSSRGRADVDIDLVIKTVEEGSGLPVIVGKIKAAEN